MLKKKPDNRHKRLTVIWLPQAAVWLLIAGMAILLAIDGHDKAVAGEAMRKYRFAYGLNGRALATKLHMDPSDLTRMETGKTPVTETIAHRFCNLFGRDMPSILKEANEMPPLDMQTISRAVGTLANRDGLSIAALARMCEPPINERELAHFASDGEKANMGPERLFRVAKALDCHSTADMVREAAKHRKIENATLREAVRIIQQHDGLGHPEMADRLGMSYGNYKHIIAGTGGATFSSNARRKLPAALDKPSLEAIIEEAKEIRAAEGKSWEERTVFPRNRHQSRER